MAELKGRNLFADEEPVGRNLFASEEPVGRNLFADDAPVGRDLFSKEEAYVPEEHSVLGTAAEFSRGGNTAVMEFIDFIGPGTANAVLRLAGIDEQLPTAMDGYKWLEDNFYGKAGEETQRQFMPSGTARDVTKALGSTATAAPGFMGVKRAATSGSAALDFLGFGSTVADDSMRELSRMGVQIAKKRSADWAALGDEALETDDAIFEAANSINKRDIIEKNRRFMAGWEEEAERIAKEQGKDYDDALHEIITEHDIPESVIKPNITKVLEDIETIYEIDPKKTLKVLQKRGGLKEVEADPIALKEAADKQFKQDPDLLEGSNVSYWESMTSPMTETLRRHAGGNVAAPWERAMETATRKAARVAEEIGQPIHGVGKLVDSNRSFKATLMDLHRAPDTKIAEARQLVQENLGDDALASFNTFIKQANRQAGEGRKFLYRADSGFDDEYYIHTALKNKKRETQATRGADPHTVKPGAVKDRGRKAAWEMTDEEIDAYANPILTHLKHMADEEYLIEIAKKFHLEPSIGRNGSTRQLFDALQGKLTRDGIDADRAEAVGNVMHHAHLGSTKAPPPLVRAFMSLGYAGTLAQVKSAMLNLHDAFVTMAKIGVKPTLKAMMQSTKGQFGKTLTDMGIGDNQAVGEFVRDFDEFATNMDWQDKVASGAAWVTEKGFKLSTFQKFDQIGKGIVVRSALNKARSAARKGELVKEWGGVLEKVELQKVRRWMQKDIPVEKFPPEVRRLVEEAVFSKLGEQQLISMAGRPLAYAKHPWARPLYAMTGFAIKQKAILRHEVHESLKGARAIDKKVKAAKKRGTDPQVIKNLKAKARAKRKHAALFAAKYAAFAGTGYGLIDETRSYMMKDEEFNPEDILFGIFEQLASVYTFNRVGDSYSLDKALDGPVEFLQQSVLPPTGLTGALAKDAAKMIGKGEFSDEVARKAPLIGDFYNYYWNPKEGKAGRDAQNKWEEFDAIWED